MADAIGGSFFVQLLEKLSEIEENQNATTSHLEALVTISRKTAADVQTVRRTLEAFAKILDDHELRLKRLEASAGK